MSIKIDIGKAVKWVVLILISLTLLFNFQEFLRFLNVTEEFGEPSILLKMGKDVGFALILFLALCDMVRRRKVAIIFPFFYVLTGILGLLFLIVNNTMLGIVGIRWVLPLFLILALFPYVDRKFMENVTGVLYVLLLIHVLSQLLQMFFGPPIHGYNFLGLAARNTGIFVYPGPSSLFTNTCFVFFLVFRNYRYSTALVGLSILLSMSSTGTFIFLSLLFIKWFYKSKYFVLLCTLIPFLALLLFKNLDTLTGRHSGDTMTSGGIRLQIFFSELRDSHFFSHKFGTATNTAVNMDLENAFIADSTYTSILANLGLLCFAAFLLSLLFSFIYVLFYKKQDILLFLTLFTLGSISVIVIEFFPINLLFALMITYFVKRELELRHQGKLTLQNGATDNCCNQRHCQDKENEHRQEDTVHSQTSKGDYNV